MAVVISPNIKKTSERIDVQGNIINPRTKKVIQSNQTEYIPTPEEVAKIAPEAPQVATVQSKPNVGALSILDQIKQAEDNLKALKELKKLKIAEKKAELELLEQ